MYLKLVPVFYDIGSDDFLNALHLQRPFMKNPNETKEVDNKLQKLKEENSSKHLVYRSIIFSIKTSWRGH